MKKGPNHPYLTSMVNKAKSTNIKAVTGPNGLVWYTDFKTDIVLEPVRPRVAAKVCIHVCMYVCVLEL